MDAYRHVDGVEILPVDVLVFVHRRPLYADVGVVDAPNNVGEAGEAVEQGFLPIRLPLIGQVHPGTECVVQGIAHPMDNAARGRLIDADGLCNHILKKGCDDTLQDKH